MVASASPKKAGGFARGVFSQLCGEKIKAGVPREKVVAIVVKEHPDVHAAMLAEENQARPKASAVPVLMVRRNGER